MCWARLEDAAEAEEGVCLNCGRQQPFFEKRLVLGLCENCGEQEVVEAELALRVIRAVEGWETRS